MTESHGYRNEITLGSDPTFGRPVQAMTFNEVVANLADSMDRVNDDDDMIEER